MSRYLSNTGEGLEPCLQLLKQAAAHKSVQPELVEGALAYLEQHHCECVRAWLQLSSVTAASCCDLGSRVASSTLNE